MTAASAGWLLDTNILSELRRGDRASAALLAWMRTVEEARCFISAVTVAELASGSAAAPDPHARETLHAWLRVAVRDRFAGRIVEVSEAVLVVWVGLLRDGRRRGMTFAAPDALIAATALVHGLTVVTRNFGDFARTGASLFNPWEAT